MIKIKKSSTPPEILMTKGLAETNTNNNLFDMDPQAYKHGKKFVFDSDIYGHETVKSQLIAEQHEKCCFCESKFIANGYGDVEHFRPKGGYRSQMNTPLKKPGYYWTAYNWDNLFFSCEVCNTSFKKNYFPLEDETKRAANHHDNLEKEIPLLIHPSQDDPGKHIRFHQEECCAKDKKGEESIKAFGINRDRLKEIRYKHFQYVHQNRIFAKIDLEGMSPGLKNEILTRFNMVEDELKKLINIARQFIKTAAKDEAEFSLMVRDNFPDLPVEEGA